MTATIEEHAGRLTGKGNPLTTLGPVLGEGDAAPAFTLAANDLSPKTLADYAGKVKVLSVVPSLDTPVCDTQTRKFNELATGLGEQVVVLTISVDLPMAQKRWCGAAGVERVECLSDYKDHAFGYDYGLRIKENGLLARTLLVLDADNVIRHLQVVPEIVDEPDYDAAVAAAKALL
ncbi:MAG: thiol peroxidase [Planctomycetota bacterium]